MDRDGAASSSLGEESSTLYIVVGVLTLIGTIVLVFYYLIRKQSRKLQFVLIVGRNDAGKTTLFVRLTQDRSALTVSSLIKNIAWTKNLIPKEPGREIQLIDIPGFERIRWDVFESSKSLCKCVKDGTVEMILHFPLESDFSRGIIFILDSVTIVRDAQEAADILYRILTDTQVQRRKLPILIACNKQDQVAAKDVEVISSLLEKEINAIRLTKYNPLTKKGNKMEYLGRTEKEFAFSHLANNKLIFTKCICSNADGEAQEDISGIVDFLRTLS